ncbi:hypothetical protein NPIL_70061 [Nephila pilipes]|uniref:Uncharacterized protein n=1 Tax=Nephila pilipes TaxID=299642 RepID=A0A8X6QMT8_NEPPI|nr:hypothetical protein NPIL_70061 [Nephila pilipes]
MHSTSSRRYIHYTIPSAIPSYRNYTTPGVFHPTRPLNRSDEICDRSFPSSWSSSGVVVTMNNNAVGRHLLKAFVILSPSFCSKNPDDFSAPAGVIRMGGSPRSF